VPREERLLIGAASGQRYGSGHNPLVAQRALEESREEVERLISRFAVIVIIATGGKGTGAGTVLPLARMAHAQKKLVIPIFVRPSFERHEVDKRRYDHAVQVADAFDAAGIRLMEVLNDCGYDDADPQPQSIVWNRMNVPIARGLRGLLYVLGDLSQVDPSDLAILMAGPGRMRIGFAEIDPQPGKDATDTEIDEAVRRCWENQYCAFDKPVGTSLVCIQGDWSNLVDARIKGRLAALATAGAQDAWYSPLHARGFQTPRPWGVTALLTEYTGVHRPLELDWTVPKRNVLPPPAVAIVPAVITTDQRDAPLTAAIADPDPLPLSSDEPTPAARLPFNGIWELARGLNRADRAAMAIAAEEGPAAIAIDELEVRKLLDTFWFRSVFPLFSLPWRERLLDALTTAVIVPNRMVRIGRQMTPLNDLTYEQLKAIGDKEFMHSESGDGVRLLLAIGGLWGPSALVRVRFGELVQADESSRLATLLSGLRL